MEEFKSMNRLTRYKKTHNYKRHKYTIYNYNKNKTYNVGGVFRKFVKSRLSKNPQEFILPKVYKKTKNYWDCVPLKPNPL